MFNNMGFTKRDKIVLVLVGILVVILIQIPQEVINAWEPPILIFVVFPLGLMVATDPERRKKGE